MDREPTGINGRDHKGRFSKGNRCGRPNRMAARATRIRSVLLSAVTPERARAIVEKVIGMAESGDLQAAREILDRVIGKPTSGDVESRLAALEDVLLKERVSNG